MEPESFTFDAFISYRRSDGAPFATRLRRKLLEYTPPEEIKARLPRTGLSIYLDEIYERATEDFFENTIKPALRASRRLIVVRTPDAVAPKAPGEPDWILKEIEYFRTLPQGRNLCIALAKGEMHSPMPGNLKADFPNIEIIDIRKLGALTRGQLGEKILTFLAALYDVPPELMPALRREEERTKKARTKRLIAASLLMGVLLIGLPLWVFSARSQARATMSQSDFQEAVDLIERGQAAQALAYLSRALRSAPANRPARELAADLLIHRNWPLSEMDVHHSGVVYSARFSPDGLRMVTASADRTARIWDVTSGHAIGLPMQHSDEVYRAEFSPDVRLVATASRDHTARLWDAATGRPIGHPMTHGDVVGAIRFSPDGRFVATGFKDRQPCQRTDGPCQRRR